MKYLNVFALIAMLFVSACTRPFADKPSSVTIALPNQMKLKASNSTQALGFLAHVVINVRGTGIDIPISINFDAKKDDANPPTSLPGSFTIDVPAGAGRLLQIMAVYVDINTMMGDFYYGDVTKDLVSGDNAISLPVSLVGSGNVEGGRVAGRYYFADGTTPTGPIETRYQPPGGKPAIVIERHSIVNGWFSTFALDTMPMDVVLVPSEVKLLPDLKLDAFDNTTLTDNKKMKILLPNRYQSYGGGDGDTKRAETAVFGFFGSGVPAGAKVCYTEAARTFSQLFTDSTKTTAIQWSVNSSNTADARAVKAATVSACSLSDITAAYTSVLPFRAALIDNWGSSEAAAGFNGVFRFPMDLSMGSSPVQVGYNNSGQYNVKFSVLPGIPDIANSIAVFYRATNSPRDYYGNGGDIPCNQFAQGGLGFVNIASIPLVSGTYDYNVNNSSPADISNNAVMAFCPMKNGVSIGGGFITDHLNGNVGAVPVAANSFSAHTDFPTVGTGQCHRLKLSLVNDGDSGTNYNVTNSSVRTFSLTKNSANISLFGTESNCLAGTSLVSSVTIASNSVNGEVWYKNTVGESNKTITVDTVSFGSAISRNIGVSFQSASAPSTLKVQQGSLKMGPNQCQIVDVYTVDSSTGIPSAVGTATTVNIDKNNMSSTVVTDTTFEFYSDCNSATAISSLAFAVGDFRKTFAVKTGGNPSSDRIIKLSGLSTFDLYFNVTPLADHIGITINNGNPVYKGSCVPLYIQAKNSANADISASFNFNMNIYHPTVPNFYGEFKYGCSTAAGSGPFTLATGSYTSLTFSAANSQSGVHMEAQSIFQDKLFPVSFEIKPAPPVERFVNSTLKVHLMSDDLSPVLTQGTFSNWPLIDSAMFGSTSNPSLTDVEKGANPRIEGALFPLTSSVITGPVSGAVSAQVMMTIKFKITSALAFSATADILALDTYYPDTFKIYIENISGIHTIKGTGGWVGPTINLNTWYTVSLSKDGSGNTYAYVNGVNNGAGTANAGNPMGTSFSNFRVGSGFIGAVKAVVIDIGGTVYTSFDIPGEHNYINGRVPNL